MRIEFSKIPFKESNFNDSLDNLYIDGVFFRINSKLAKVVANLDGQIDVECSRCAKVFEKEINENLEFFLSDGIFRDETDDLVIEVKSIVDFQEILESEKNSFESDYHLCDDCKNKEFKEIEY